MKTADQILQMLLNRIQQVYGEPQFVVHDVCELEGLLFELHWLHANATDTLEEYVAVLTRETPDKFKTRIQLRDSQRLVELPEHAAEVIERWRRIDDQLGLNCNQG